ncbi:MAG: MlaD family protein [Gemmatimonadetes bacterium]|nr:MlaD family protein [Gemmatimonadota bacterium]
MSNTDPSHKRRLTDEEVARAVPPTAGVREFRVGIFVILGIVGFFTVLFLMTSPGTFRNRYMVTTHVDDAQGIRRGDPVRMRGINIGRVYRFEMHPEGGVMITLEVEGEWPIPRGSRTELKSMGVLGGMVVSVLPGDGGGVVGPRELLPGRTVDDVLDSAGDLATDASNVFASIQNLLSDSNVAGAGEAITQLREVLRDLSEITEGQAAEVRSLTESLKRSAANVEGITGAEEWARTLALAEVTLANLDRTSAGINETVTSLNVIVARMERGEGTLGRLSTDETLYETLDAAAQSLRELLDDVKANPGRYLKLELF